MAEPQEARACANVAQAAEWDGPAGAHRTRHAAVFDAETRPHNEPVYYGPDPAVAFDVVRGLRSTRDLLAGLDAAEADRALDRLRAALAAHRAADGVFFDARSWIIAARRR